ncbi:uncharacterized protein BDCG_17970 [Blastomyces dermatitidis ER-3]|uniref:Uncharacterized protein n=1 Tax=Ajellomyces dermatitidis (strain ER-3 / ATCC MYA-2586) TaxID=559297 RepID=A0ABX2W1C8_AJEDR|nr:uncharacterized protein BDCG_17970 [Blastomyces dermatitidis ER-3]OAT03185.1 hypothetical protein BDCG_17970 [Blastomyces dermatitidis ER-3]
MSQSLIKDSVSFESQDTQCQMHFSQYSSSLEDEFSLQSLQSLNNIDDEYDTSDSDLTELESIDTSSEFEITDTDTDTS